MSREAPILKLIYDLIGPENSWPHVIKQKFFTKRNQDLKYFDRFFLTTFAYVNGLPVNTLLDYLNSRGNINNPNSRHHINDLYQKFESGTYNHKPYYSYNIFNAQWEYINGKRKHRNSHP